MPATLPAPELPAEPRSALVVATGAYQDAQLRRMRSPARDAAAMAAVLQDPQLGGFGVTRLVDAPSYRIGPVLEQFTRSAGADDLIVVYVSCHGLLDEEGTLHFAARNTVLDETGQLMTSTAVAAPWLIERVKRSRARRKVVILDCCFSGMFDRAKAGAGLDLDRRLGVAQGSGLIVLTASSAMEYSYEQDPTSRVATGSVFTSSLVEGLRSGAADADRDGYVSVDEAYAYALARMKESGAAQTPKQWLYSGVGKILLTRSPAGLTVEPAPLPADVLGNLQSGVPNFRIAAVHELGLWLADADPTRVLAAKTALEAVAEDDIPRVAQVAAELLAARTGAAGGTSGAAGTVAQEVREELPAPVTVQHRPSAPSEIGPFYVSIPPESAKPKLRGSSKPYRMRQVFAPALTAALQLVMLIIFCDAWARHPARIFNPPFCLCTVALMVLCIVCADLQVRMEPRLYARLSLAAAICALFSVAGALSIGPGSSVAAATPGLLAMLSATACVIQQQRIPLASTRELIPSPWVAREPVNRSRVWIASALGSLAAVFCAMPFPWTYRGVITLNGFGDGFVGRVFIPLRGSAAQFRDFPQLWPNMLLFCVLVFLLAHADLLLEAQARTAWRVLLSGSLVIFAAIDLISASDDGLQWLHADALYEPWDQFDAPGLAIALFFAFTAVVCTVCARLARP